MSSKYRKTFSIDGVRYQVYGKTEQEAIEKMAIKKQAVRDGKDFKESSMLVSDWAYEAVELYKTNQSEITRERYLGVMKSSVLREIGNMKLRSVTNKTLQSCLNLQQGRSKYHIDRVCNMLKFIFTTAYQNKLIKENPSENLVKPKGENNKRRSITEEERKAFIKVANNNDKYLRFLLMYHCGCRPSEVRSVTYKNISVVEGTPLLHVQGTKSANADRFIPVPEDLVVRIKKSLKSTISKPQYTKRFASLKTEMEKVMGKELKKDFVPYCLRHTFCTDLRDKGVDIRDAQYLMGHANISITANIYTHSDVSTALKVAKVTQKVTQ